MERYEIRFKRSVSKDLRGIQQQDLKGIFASIKQLADHPRGPHGIKLSDQQRYRIRQGDFRILYEISDAERIVTIVKVARRSRAYKDS